MRLFSGVRRSVKRIWQRRQPRAVILMYHRVADVAEDPHGLCVSPEHFAQHVHVLQRGFEVIPLREIPSRARDGRLSRRSVAITFDDGYADSLHAVRPLCDRYETPATVFVTTGHLDGLREFWWDELEALTLGREATAARELRVPLADEVMSWPAGAPMRAIYDTLHARLRPATREAREQALATLAQWRGVTRAVRADHRPLTQDECRQLSQSRFVDVQSHTVNHLWLAAHPVAVQAAELGESRTHLEQLTGRPITALAYPYGFRDAVAPVTLALARQAGYSAACATVRGQVGRTTDPLWLPRYVPGDVEGDELVRRLNGFFDDFAMPHPPRGGGAPRAAEAAPKESE